MRNIFHRFFYAFFPFVFFTSPILAQEASKNFLILPWVVGQSATYQTKTYKNNNLVHTETTTYSIVDQEEVKGNKYFWIEIDHEDSAGPTIILKLQVREPQGIDFENYLAQGVGLLKPRRKIVKTAFGNDKKFSTTNEFEVPADSVSQIENGPAPSATKDLSADYTIESSQTLQARGRNLKATKFHHSISTEIIPTPSKGQKAISQFADSWGSPDVPIWGEVKRTTQSIDKEQNVWLQQTELIASSERGAVSKIKATPQFIPLTQKKTLQRSLFPNDAQFPRAQDQ